ncbi:MAG: GDP-mannose 4,6-dehydratase [Planctomycetota bacterium]|nr:GDP-mannose 4,6-dehydratase [Planctomycetota bacterium]
MAHAHGHVLVTGGAGFIGSHLAESLLRAGRRVIVIDDLSTGLYSNVAALDGNTGFRLYVESIRNERLLRQLLRRCETVYHLASAVGVKLIMDKPVYTIDNIYQGTETVLRLARCYRNRVLITSTSEVYGKSEDIPFREDGDRLDGPTTKHRWAYACAKALDEFLALAHWKETRLAVIIVRLFNTVGPRQRSHYGMVLPRFVKWALAGEDLQVYGDGTQARCFCHVADVVAALTQLMDSRRFYGEVFNVGSREEVTIRALAERVISRTRSKSRIRLVPYQNVHGEGFEDMQRRVPCLRKIRAAIGWQPTLTLNRIIDDVARDLKRRRARMNETASPHVSPVTGRS